MTEKKIYKIEYGRAHVGGNGKPRGYDNAFTNKKDALQSIKEYMRKN